MAFSMKAQRAPARLPPLVVQSGANQPGQSLLVMDSSVKVHLLFFKASKESAVCSRISRPKK
jgi:hypothetical protein